MTKDNSVEQLLFLFFILFVVFLVLYLRKRRKEKILNTQLFNEIKEKQALLLKINNLDKELYEKKLEGLRFMLNPHSFRNTLNTIQHLAKNTLNSVENLAGIFDYMLYDAQQKYVSLEKEIKFANEYLHLYKLRLSPVINFKVDLFENAFEDFYRQKNIPPMIFAHFIENAFKHGDLDGDEAFIHIKLEVISKNEIVYSVRNRVSPKKNTIKGGLGNEKFIERLDLLYPGKYNLDLNEHNSIYSANLKIVLHES
jgi:two-component system LytT family sensor kinase